MKKFMSLFLALVMVCSLSVSVFANSFGTPQTNVASIIGGNPYTTLQAAVDDAVDSNTIVLLRDTPDESEVVVSKEITISNPDSRLITNGVSAGDGYTMSTSEDGLTYTFTRDSSSTIPSSGNETVITYTGAGSEAYTITVPTTLQPGQSGTVKAEGTWATNRTLKVTTANTVTVANSIDGGEKVLDVTFAGIDQAGDNETSIIVSKSISVGSISNALFGTWTGVITYNVSMEDAVTAPTLISFTIAGTSYQAEEGMTWGEWADSEYDTNDNFRAEVPYNSNFEYIYANLPGYSLETLVAGSDNIAVLASNIIESQMAYRLFDPQD